MVMLTVVLMAMLMSLFMLMVVLMIVLTIMFTEESSNGIGDCARPVVGGAGGVVMYLCCGSVRGLSIL